MVSEVLVAQVDRLDRVAYQGLGYRHIARPRDPLSGAGARTAGGRWNPRESFSVLYLGLDTGVVSAEFARMAARQGRKVTDFLPRRLYTYEIHLSAVLDLTDQAAREALGLTDEALSADELGACQEVGAAAHYAGFEAVLAPSATSRGTVLAVFMDNLDLDSSVQVAHQEEWRASGDVDK